MRQFLRITLRVLILAAVFLASALMAMRLAIHGREVAVPKVLGLSATEAGHAASLNGLLLDVEDRFYSADVPEGHVLSQLPPVGEKVRRGTRLRVALSLGRQKIVVPDVVGQSQRAAQINIGRRGLELGYVAVAHLPGKPPDQVVAQSPLPNAEGVATPRVNVLISAPADPGSELYMVPDFIGHTLEEASRAIAESPMRFGKVATRKNGLNGKQNAIASTPAPSAPEQKALARTSPTIVKQDPAAGQKIPAGTPINFEVVR